MTESEKNIGAEIVEVLKTAEEQAEVILNYLDHNPNTEEAFIRIIKRYGELLTPMLCKVLQEAVLAEAHAQALRLIEITTEYERLRRYSALSKEECLALVQLAFK